MNNQEAHQIGSCIQYATSYHPNIVLDALDRLARELRESDICPVCSATAMLVTVAGHARRIGMPPEFILGMLEKTMSVLEE
jgi:hypothetical protein